VREKLAAAVARPLVRGVEEAVDGRGEAVVEFLEGADAVESG
jgi:hypothetical protein